MTEVMRFEQLERDVTRIGLGTSAIGGSTWSGEPDEEKGRTTVARALELGLDLIDTAAVYGAGRAERVIGRALAEAGARERVVIATKGGLNQRHGRERRDGSRDAVLRDVDGSLARLGTDHVDLYQLHFPDPATPLAETARVFADLHAEGVARAVGVCNMSVAGMREWMEYAPLHACQGRYNLFQRESEAEVLPFCRELGLLFIAYSPLARGLLAGGMTERREPSDEARAESMFHGEEYERHLLAVARLGGYAEEIYDKRVIDLAVRWVLDRSGGVALWGARRPDQLAPLPGIWGWGLDAPAFAEMDGIVAEALDTKAVKRAVPR